MKNLPNLILNSTTANEKSKKRILNEKSLTINTIITISIGSNV